MDISESGLHIISGLSAAGSWKQAFHQTDRLLVQQDLLSCGPTPFCKTLSEWEKIRIAYLKELHGDWEYVKFNGLGCDLLTNAHNLHKYDHVFIWAGTGIEDQFLILFVVYLAALVSADLGKFQLIQFEKFQVKDFLARSMGILIPDRIRDHPEPKSLTINEVDYLRSAWSAITSDIPSALNHFITESNPAFPYIIDALKYLMRRYPQRQSGLPYWDWKLVKNIPEHGPSAARIIGYTMALDFPEDGDHVGDLYLFYRLCKLANQPKPLIELKGKQESLRDTDVSLTEFGNEVLDGKASSYPANPINEWIGGVHLSSKKGNLWFYDNGKLIKKV